MKRVRLQHIDVGFRIEVWNGSLLLHTNDQHVSLEITADLRWWARQTQLPLETIAYLVLKPNVEHMIVPPHPLTFRVVPATPLSWATSEGTRHRG